MVPDPEDSEQVTALSLGLSFLAGKESSTPLKNNLAESGQVWRAAPLPATS